MEWLLLAAFGIMWAALVIPMVRKRSAAKSVEDFESRMELLAHAGAHGSTGRWIVTPRKGIRFLGPQERERARARERRRRVFTFLLEAIGLTILIGLVPPLRVIWYVAAALGVLLVLYVWLLLSMKHHAAHPHDTARAARVPAQKAQVPAPTPRYVAEGRLGWARPTFNGLGALDESDSVHVVVRPASATGV